MAGRLSRVIGLGMVAGLLAPGLSACGVAPIVAQQTTAAALAPFQTAAQATNATLQTLGRGMSTMTAQSAQTARQIQIANANAARYRPIQQPQPVSYATPRPSPASKSARSKDDQAATKQVKPTLDVLPQETLKRLTEDQAGLQRAAQSEAMTATVGETIFWKLDGREGTAVAEDEAVMGGFTCRTFTQTIALEDYYDAATLKACRNGSGAWLTSF
jgi:surface antigen